MCGITGIVDFSRKGISEGKSLIAKMNKAMELRGPDASGVWTNEKEHVFLGHQRLSILDLSEAGNQPMVSEDRKHSIVFNGEVYNFNALKHNLSEAQFRSNTDTEVLLKLYTHQQLDWNKLRGMFAVAIWDEDKNQLLLAKDRAGQKPLYYTTQNGIFAFSSQLKSLLQLPWIKKELDEEALYHFLTFNQLSPPYTLFKGIKKFEAGHEMVVDPTGIKSYEPYWEIGFNRLDYVSKNESQLSDEVFETLKNAVDYRMISDVPVGAFLSGGVDSSAVVALMKEKANFTIKTYSIGFEGQPDYDELEFARAIAKRYGTEHFERVVNPEDFKRLLPKIVQIFDEPLSDSTCIPIYFLSELAKENGTKVILTGDGADELYGGYSNWKKYMNWVPYFNLFNQLPTGVKTQLAKTYGKYKKESPIYEILVRSSKGQEFFWSGARGLKEATKHQFLSQGFQERNNHLNSYSQIVSLKEAFESSENASSVGYLNWLCYCGLKDIVPNFYLNRLDKLTMAHSIEGRAPFMDHDVIESAFSVPEGYKIKNGEAKYILKKSLERILPPEVLYRKKKGFCVPLREWGSEIMQEYITEHLTSFCEQTDVFKQSSIEQLLTQVKQGNTDLTNTLWTVYFIMNWHKTWIQDGQ